MEEGDCALLSPLSKPPLPRKGTALCLVPFPNPAPKEARSLDIVKHDLLRYPINCILFLIKFSVGVVTKD